MDVYKIKFKDFDNISADIDLDELNEIDELKVKEKALNFVDSVSHIYITFGGIRAKLYIEE